MFDFYGMIDNYEQRKVENTVVGEIVIDTAQVTDSDEPYETGIYSPLYNNGEWVIVEMYTTKEEAAKGHEKWVKAMSTPPQEIKDVGTSTIKKIADLFKK